MTECRDKDDLDVYKLLLPATTGLQVRTQTSLRVRDIVIRQITATIDNQVQDQVLRLVYAECLAHD